MAKDIVIRRTREGLGFPMVGSFADAMELPVRLTLRDYTGRKDYEIMEIPFGKNSFDKLYRQLCSGKISIADKQNRARFRARSSLAEKLITASVVYAAHCDSDLKLSDKSKDNKAVKPGLSFNEDTFAGIVGN